MGNRHVGPILAAAFLFLAASAPAESPVLPLKGRTIVIDPGHAVLNEAGAIINPGARARRGVWERDVVLAVGEKLAPILEERGAKVVLTRTAGNPWRYSRRKQADNRARAIFANVLKADAYIRLHCDWNRSRQFKGFTTFYYRWGSRSLAKRIRNAMVSALPGHRDNGLHRRSFVSATSRMPAVLVELGTLSYKSEADDLAKDEYRQKLAQAVADGITDYFVSQ